MIRLLHLADLHLGWPPRFIADPAVAQSYAEARWGVFDAAVAAALDPTNRIDAVVIAGDLFDDHRPASALVERVIAGLARVCAHGIALLTVPGNHDEITYGDSVYRTYAARWPGILVNSPALNHVASLRLGPEAVHFYGLAYTGGITEVQRPLASFPRLDQPGVHIAVIHGTVTGSGQTGWVVQERSLPLDGAALAAAGYDYIALGHIHRPGVAPAAGNQRAVYAGLVAGRGFDDPGCGKLTVASIGAPGQLPQLSYLPVDLPAVTRQPARLDGAVSQPDAITQLTSQLNSVPAGALVEVELSGVISQALDTEALAAALTAVTPAAYVVVRDRTSLLAADQVRRWAEETTLRGFFVRRLLEAADGSVQDDGCAADAADRQQLAERALRYGLAALERGRR